MHRLRPYPVAVFCAVTLFIWVNRIWLTWTNGTDTVARKVLWTIPIGAFVLAATALLVAMIGGVDRGARWFRLLVQGFALGTAAYWMVRLPMIAVNEHPDLTASEEVAFTIVHAVLAIVSVGAAWFAFRWARRTPADETSDGAVADREPIAAPG
ncbi:hypothetical protein ACE2AJ_04490 [Aquihabitans daechungensis]|uniref:hypothetical protein n=1 Tax=Aquihabitans daechungensis TaxID=1052257 RepID=UPI003BA3B919